jgi:hypothetical protein
MPVSEISKGVFIVAPRDLPKYKDTAAGEYTSVFTKQRANQWEMAQKQALLNIELGSKRYEEEMKTLRERIKSLDARTAENKSLTIQVAEGRVKAEDAAAIVAEREATSRQKTAADFKAKGAAQGVTSGGGTSVSSGGGGRRGDDPAAISTANKAELGLAKDAAPPSDPGALAAQVRTRLDDRRFVTTTPAEGDAIRHGAVNEMVDAEMSRLMAADPNLSYNDARGDAISNVEPKLSMGNRDFFDAYERVEGKIDAADTAAGTPRETTTTRELEFFKKYPNLGTLPEAKEDAPAVASRDAVNTLLAAQLAEIEAERAALARPTFGGTDYITDARDIMRGRFGGFSGAADALPYEQRNVAERLLKDPAYGLSAIEGYRDYLAKQRSEADTALRFRESMAEGPANTSVEALRGAPLLRAEQAAAQTELTRAAGQDLLQSRRPSIFDGLVAPAAPQIPERAALNIPMRTALTEPPAVMSVPTDVVAPVEPPPPAQSVPEAVTEAPVALRPEAADLMTPAERAEFYERLRASAEARQFRKELSAIDTGGSEINPDFRLPLSPPPVAPRQALSTMAAPPQVAAPFDMQFAVPRTPAPPPAALGTKEEGPLVVASPAMAPSTSGAAPRGPADVSAAVRPAGPLAGKLPYQIKDETERFAKSTEMADDVRKATKASLQPTAYGIKKGGPPSTVGYFQNRAEVALELKDKRGKLDRIASSGAGKVAKDLWGQNSKLGKPFENTWQEIQMTFAGDQKSLETAHEVALAYDIIAKEDKAPLKQSPK